MKDLFNKTEYFPTFIYNLSVSSPAFLSVELQGTSSRRAQTFSVSFLSSFHTYELMTQVDLLVSLFPPSKIPLI